MLTQAKTERDLVIDYRNARQLKEDAEAALKKANLAVEEAEKALVEILEAHDKKATAKYEGLGFVVMKKPRIYARFDKENEGLVFQFLKNEKREDLIKETINSQTLSSFVKERLEVGAKVPEYITYYLKPNLALQSK